MEHMAAQMDRQIEGAISENERLAYENEELRLMVTWAYNKLHTFSFAKQDDALMMDRIKLALEHGFF